MTTRREFLIGTGAGLAAVGAFPEVGEVGAATSSADFAAVDAGVEAAGLDGALSLAAVGALPEVGEVGATSSAVDLAAVAAGVAASSVDLTAALAILPSATFAVVAGALKVTDLVAGLTVTSMV